MYYVYIDTRIFIYIYTHMCKRIYKNTCKYIYIVYIDICKYVCARMFVFECTVSASGCVWVGVGGCVRVLVCVGEGVYRCMCSRERARG